VSNAQSEIVASIGEDMPKTGWGSSRLVNCLFDSDQTVSYGDHPNDNRVITRFRFHQPISHPPGLAVSLLHTAETDRTASDLAPGVAGFRGPQVCAIVGITYRQLDYWARTDLLRPSLVDAKGSGSQRLYSYRDLVELKVIKSLLDAGVGLGAARRAITYLRSNLGEDLANANLVLSGEHPLLVRDGGEILDLVRQGQGVLNIVSLESMKTRIDNAIIEMRPVDATEVDISDPPSLVRGNHLPPAKTVAS
jgi:DNA-binding transcriptional MerR regulator